MRASHRAAQGTLCARICEDRLGHGRNSAIVLAASLHAIDPTWRRQQFLRALLSLPPLAADPTTAVLPHP